MVVQSPLAFSAPLSTPLDYLAKDYDTFLQAEVKYAQQKIPDYKDWTEGSVGVMFMELIAYSHGVMAFLLDTAAQEFSPDTCRERRNMIQMMRLIGYKMGAPTAASVMLRIDPETMNEFDSIEITKGALVSSNVGTAFEIAEDYLIDAADSTAPHTSWKVNGEDQSGDVYISAVEGKTYSYDTLGTGLPFQTVKLPVSPVIEGSFNVKVSSVLWTQVDSLVVGNPDDPNDLNIYEVFIDEDGIASVKFGDGASRGAVAAEGAVVEIEYRVGGGVLGNVPADAIQSKIEAIADGNPVQLQVSNPSQGSGGSDAETLEHARFFGPLTVKTNQRFVTYNDWFALCNGFTSPTQGRIAKAGILAEPTDGLANYITVYAFTADDQDNLVAGASQTLKKQLSDFIEKRRVTTTYPVIVDGELVPVNLKVRIVVQDGYDPEVVSANVQAALAALFQESRVRYGNELRGSWVCDATQGVLGVRWYHFGPSDGVEGSVAPFDQVDILNLPGLSLQPIASGQSGLDQTVLGGNVQRRIRIQRSVPFILVTPQVTAVEDVLNSFLIVDTSSYAAPPGTGSNPYLRIIDQYDYNEAGVPTPPANVLIVDKDKGSNYSLTPIGYFDFSIHHPRMTNLGAAVQISKVDQYKYRTLHIVDGTGKGQERTILASWPNNCGVELFQNLVYLDRDWAVLPDTTSQFVILPNLVVPQSKALVSGNLVVEVLKDILVAQVG